MQRVLDVATAQQREKILEIAKPNLNSLRRFTYGKHIITKVEKIAAGLQQAAGSAASPQH
jgi:pumilio RNA-binding family